MDRPVRGRRPGRARRPLLTPTPPREPNLTALEAQVLALRAQRHRGAVFLVGELGLVASTVGRILARHQVPALATIDPITGQPPRQRRGGLRYGRRRPGELLHVNVKKLGRIPEGDGWRLHGRVATTAHKHKPAPIGNNYLRRHRRPPAG